MTTKKKTAASKAVKAEKATAKDRAQGHQQGHAQGHSQGKKRGMTPLARRMKGASWLSILESVVIGVLGVILINYPNEILKVIFYIVGLFLIVKGLYKIVNYFAVHGKYDFYNNDLLYGIIALVFGILAVVLWDKLSWAIGLVVGAWMIYGALVRLNSAIKLHTAGVKSWFYMMLLSLIMLALGVYMIVSLGVVFAVIGWVMLGAAVVGVVDDLIFIANVGKI